MIDTHCHLNSERFAGDVQSAVDRAAAAGVEKMLVVGYDLPSSRLAVQLADVHPGVICAVVGVHPHDARNWSAEAAAEVRQLAAHLAVVAIGEIGLDFHYDFSTPEEQYAPFREQLALAREAGLPVVVHCREAYPETLAVLAEAGEPVAGVMHCWGGSDLEAARCVELGMHLGFGGTLTFKNADQVRACARAAPLDRILLETDAPYLAPVPYRGQRNEPAYVVEVAKRLAELRETTVEAVDETTTTNALRLFHRLRIPEQLF